MKKRLLAISTVLILAFSAPAMAESFCYTSVQTSIDSWTITIYIVPGGSVVAGDLWISKNQGVTWEPMPAGWKFSTGLGSPWSISNVRLQRRHWMTGVPIGPIHSLTQQC